MAEIIKLNATLREGIGKNRVDKLRVEKQIPAVVYGREKDNLVIQLDAKELEKAYSEAGSSTILNIDLDGTQYPVLFKEVQKHPYKNQFVHVDFYAVNMKEKLRLYVPIVLIGKENIRLDQDFVLVQGVNEVEMECLPGDIPEVLECDISGLDFETPIFIKDLDVFQNDKVQVLTDPEDVVVSLSMPQEQTEEEDVEAVSAADVEVIGKDKDSGENE